MDLPLSFRTIDFERDHALSVAFTRDTFVCSFGSDERFMDGPEAIDGYLHWLRDAIADQPSSPRLLCKARMA